MWSKACKKYSGMINVVARVLMGGFFVLAGVGKAMDIQGTAGFMASAGIPFSGVLVYLVIIFLVVVGLLFISGKKTCLVAGLLGLYVILATLIFHIGEGQMQAFMKNAALLGGLMAFMSACHGTCGVMKDEE